MGSGKAEPPPPTKKPIESASAPVQYAVTQERSAHAQDRAAQNSSLELLKTEEDERTNNLLR